MHLIKDILTISILKNFYRVNKIVLDLYRKNFNIDKD